MAMAEEEILHLYDSFWFQRFIFSNNSRPETPSSESDQSFETPSSVTEALFSCSVSGPRLLRLRSRSHHDLSSAATSFLSDSISPNSVLATRKLHTIVSGKEEGSSEGERVVVKESPPARGGENKGRRRRCSRSLSDLEFEELKGFMDLGFVFSEEDKKDSSLASIIPGLQRLRKKQEEEDEDGGHGSEKSSVQVCRPYLSEAWEVMEKRRREMEKPLLRVPFLVNDGVDMKDQLRLWAHTVASTVR